MILLEKSYPPRNVVRKICEIQSSHAWKSIANGDTRAVRNKNQKRRFKNIY